jgi:hypothetical protein
MASASPYYELIYSRAFEVTGYTPFMIKAGSESWLKLTPPQGRLIYWKGF